MKNFTVIKIIICVVVITIVLVAWGGYSYIDLAIADSAFEKRLYTEAFEKYTQHQEELNSTQRYNLGFQYRYGYGTKRNLSEAEKLFSVAEKDGNIKAMKELGFMYERGIGVMQDLTTARIHYQKAAMVGDPEAMGRVGCLYEAENSIDDAKYWYERGALLKDFDSRYRLAEMFYFGKTGVRRYDSALYWYRATVDQNNDSSMFKMGTIYFSALQYSAAEYWFDRAALLGNAGAKAILEPRRVGTTPYGFIDNFDDNKNKWLLLNQDSKYETITDGTYVIDGRLSDRTYRAFKKFQIDTGLNFSCTVVTKWKNGEVNEFFGIDYYSDIDRSSFYCFGISSDGHYLISYKMNNGNWTPIQIWTQSSSINTREQENILKIERRGVFLNFYINDIRVATIQSGRVFGRYFCLHTEGEQKIEFDDFKLFSD